MLHLRQWPVHDHPCNYLESESTSENGHKYLFVWGHVPFLKVLEVDSRCLNRYMEVPVGRGLSWTGTGPITSSRLEELQVEGLHDHTLSVNCSLPERRFWGDELVQKLGRWSNCVLPVIVCALMFLTWEAGIHMGHSPCLGL